jgi:hypothetical protein
MAVASSALAEIGSASPATSASAAPTLSAMPDLPSPFACGAMNRAVETFAMAPAATMLTSNGEALFWTDGKSVQRVSVSGEATTIVPASPGAARIVNLVALDADLFVVRRKDDGNCVGSIERVDTADGGRREVVRNRCVDRLAVSRSHLAWIAPEWFPGGYEEERVSVKARVSGADTKVLTRSIGPMAGIALTEDRLVISFGSGRVESSALADPDRLAPVSGTAPVRFSFNASDQRLLAVDAAHAYFFGSGSRQGGLRVFRAPLDGKNTETIGSYADLERPAAPGMAWAVNPSHLHFTLPSAGLVFRADKTGRCGVERLAADRATPEWPALAGDGLFWLELGAKPIVISRMKL